MYRRVLRSALVLLVVSAPYMAHAALIAFDHIEYDPAGADAGREWVRIHNVSGSPLDLSNWRFVEGGTNHKLRALGTSIVPAASYAVIATDGAQYAHDHAGAGDVIFDSTFSLSNTGETLAFTDASLTTVASTTYTATPKRKPEPVVKTKQTAVSKRSAPRLLTNESPHMVAAAADAPVTRQSGLWPWLFGAVLLGVGAGGSLWYVRQGRSDSGYRVIDISDKKD